VLSRAGALTGSKMRDPYSVLGVAKTASLDEIKKAYRKLAKKFHPDQSKDPKAKDRFAEVSSAYEIVGDEAKRAQFDRGEIDAEGKPRYQGFEGFGAGAGPGGYTRRSPGGGGFEHFEFRGAPGGGGGFDAGDIFSELFGQARRGGAGQQQTRPLPRGEDVTAEISVSLREAVHGGKSRVSLPTGRTLEINVPAGMEDGKTIRLKGQGHPSAYGGEAGDALVTVKIARHPYFRVDNRDLRLDLPLTLYEAVLGAKVNVPTLDGKVELTVPAGSNGGRTLRLRGKGLPNPSGTAGDLLVTLRIILPDGPDPDLTALAEKWEKDRPYDPRHDLG
jgi:DnaJ-class molecular chaperone